MRLLSALALTASLLSACTQAQYGPPPVDPLAARADSLLALPPDSLSAQEAAWLQAYATRAASEETPQEQVRKAAQVTNYVIGGLMMAGVIAWAIVTLASKD